MNPEQLNIDGEPVGDKYSRIENLEGRLSYWDSEREVAFRSLVTATKERLKVQDEITRLEHEARGLS